MNGEIYSLIGKAMADIGAIEKKDKNPQQGWKYRGIDAVYNSLNPVMAKYGLFVLPEILKQEREERKNAKGNAIIYTILTIKYTMYAPDGSNVSCVVVGEAMDTGDKSANKAMSAALKYAMFQLFMIPTEELQDPDAEAHEVTPKKLTDEQMIKLEFDIAAVEKETGIKQLREKLCNRVGVKEIKDMDEAQYKRAMSALQKTREIRK
jgi:hypothetical protein